MFKEITYAGVLAACLFGFGCAYSPAGFTDSTQLLDPNEVTAGPKVVGSSAYFNFFGFPFGNPDYDAAIQDALSSYSGPNRGLLEARAYFKNSFVFVGTISTLYVEGKVAVPVDRKKRESQKE